MSDYERYGDYNDVEEDLPKSKNPIIIMLKIMIAVICVGVVGIIAFRIIAFNVYPSSVKNFYVNETFKEYYREKNGEVDIKTQKILAPYDDEDEGNFFCNHLYLVDDINQLQVTVRYNNATVEKISRDLGIELDADSEDLFTYRLYADYEDGRRIVGELTTEKYDTQLMYKYEKLVFDNVDFSTDEFGSPYWIRLEILVKGYEDYRVFMVLVYENNAHYSNFEDYEIG